MTPLRQRMIEDMQARNLAPHTQRAYLQHVSQFARHFRKSPELLGPAEIHAFELHLARERKLAASSIRVAVAASTPFRRDVAIRIGDLPPPATPSGAAFDGLVGPWIEHVPGRRYRVSPLALSAGQDALATDGAAPVLGQSVLAAGCWALLWTGFLVVFPYSARVRVIYLFNEKVRGALSLWFLPAIMTLLPFLRRRMLLPFREELLADAHLTMLRDSEWYP